ncbi:SCO7613 C-terminal domain-containing membrane protein [Lentibacillus sp. CBA3610]|uniref:SCO7613 C-terminal domain-containing membrane protein n=1 Tax=Lentibacillus sp. CBA3610 TaxID=2518176 RepID=UPI0015954E20|nr:hypothetical protein [Lentibacillus sp. CBA3610]QKY70136.1 hypothetical protein Len3610_11535 [Lentibacillus sp. CBA3610]
MDQSEIRLTQQTVKKELEKLEEAEYISSDVHTHVVKAHNQYYADLKQQEAEAEKAMHDMETTDDDQSSEFPETDPVKEKKTLSPKEIRERNITWSLNLGVVLLLIGGLVLATSTWDTLANWMKSGLMMIVSLLFFGLAVLTMRVLKIEKTAFAFYVLGSLFLPIAILSVGYFELLGPYFSFTGAGRYLFGAAGSLVMLPVYVVLADKLSSRLFVWFSYITVTVLAGLLLAALYLPVDGFYLGIMLFNGLLLLGYARFKNKQRITLFMKEFVLYIQCSLILSTLLMLSFYDHEMMYGFSVLLTAVIYFAMIYVTEHKEYSFVFSAMLVYGAYQLIEFSVLQEAGAIGYALLGFVFLAIPRFIDDDHALKRIFRYTSAVVSLCAFLYISFEGIILRMNEPSFVLLLAYVLIALNFAFLANMTKRLLFAYLSPIFLMSALYEVVLFSRDWFGYDEFMLPIFVTGLFLYAIFGCLMHLSFFQRMKESSRDVGGVVMLLAVLADFLLLNWWQTGTMLMLLSITTLLMERYEKRTTVGKGSSWLHAVSLGLAVMMFYAAANGGSTLYGSEPMEAESFVLAGLVVLLASFGWKQVYRQAFAEHTFFTAYGFYGLGMWLTLTFDFDAVLRSVIMLGGVAMAYLLYRKMGWMVVSYVVSGISLLFYMTVLYAIHSEMTIQSDLFQSLQFVIGAVLLLIVGVLINKHDTGLRKSFWWAGHLFLPFALLTSLLFFGEETVWAFLIAAALYGLSLRWARAEWRILCFLYGGFFTFWIGIVQWFVLLDLAEPIQYAALATSILMAVGWYISKAAWTRRIAFYVIPFSVFGIFTFMLVPDFDVTLFALTLLYAVLTLFMMHREQWDLFTVVPLVLVYSILWRYDDALLSPAYFMSVRLVGFAGLLAVAGWLMYPVIYQTRTDREIPYKIDWYSIIGFVALFNLYAVTTEALWTKLLPGLLISLFLIGQRKRIPYVPAKWVTFSACVYFLQPYYVLLGNVQIPDIIERELYALPWVAAMIVLKKIADRQHKSLVNNLQWAVLVVVSLMLIQDGLASSTIYDALIIGVLSLASLLGGMAYQIKAFFFVGAGVLLLNVLLQTRDYWGNMPWWAYLLIAGSILIAVASYNEWHKQKTADGKTTLASTFYRKVIERLKRWE